LFTIGRLDVESEGAIILTNDGDLCHRITHPSFQVTKSYLVEVEGSPTSETIAKMRKGIWLSEGRTGALDIRVVKRQRHRAHLEVRLNEGMKREIRRVFARFGHEVRRLVRVSIGPVDIGPLEPGETRELTPDEIKALRDTTNVVIKLGAAPPPKAQHRTRGRRRPPPRD
jgi:23S rRNA pseudouridine2605 synthase